MGVAAPILISGWCTASIGVVHVGDHLKDSGIPALVREVSRQVAARLTGTPLGGDGRHRLTRRSTRRIAGHRGRPPAPGRRGSRGASRSGRVTGASLPRDRVWSFPVPDAARLGSASEPLHGHRLGSDAGGFRLGRHRCYGETDIRPDSTDNRTRSYFDDDSGAGHPGHRRRGAGESAARRASAACFANPGTTEMPIVAALDAVPGIRAVLGLPRERLHREPPMATPGSPAVPRSRCSPWPRPGERAGQPPQRAAGAHAGGEPRRRPRELAPALRRAAHLRHRRLAGTVGAVLTTTGARSFDATWRRSRGGRTTGDAVSTVVVPADPPAGSSPSRRPTPSPDPRYELSAHGSPRSPAFSSGGRPGGADPRW